MPLFNYLQLQPIDPQDDGSVSELDTSDQDETIDLTADINGDELAKEWSQIELELHSDSGGITES